MRHDETLADWIGDDAERRFLKIPQGDVPRVMEWVMYITGCTDADLIDEITDLLTGMNGATVQHAEFRNSVLYHEARKRHREIGHGEDCIADTAYSKAVKRVNDSTAPESPCECGGVPQPGDWEGLRRLFVTADWSVTIKTLSNSGWMDLRRKHPVQTLHMAIMRPFGALEQSGAYIYEPNRKKWFTVTEEQVITLAWQSPSRFLAAVAGISNAHLAPPPPYLHRLPEGKMRLPGPGSANRVNVHTATAPTPAPMADLPVSMSALSSPETASVKSLAKASGGAFLDAVLTWLHNTHPSPRVFLCEDLIVRTCSALNYLPAWYGRMPGHLRPTPGVRRRRGAILRAVVVAIGVDVVAPWPDVAQADLIPAPKPPPTTKPVPPAAPVRKKAKPSGGMRIETCQVLAELFPVEFAALQEEMSGKQALLKLKEKHYKLFSEVRRGLMEGRSADEVLAELSPELKAG